MLTVIANSRRRTHAESPPRGWSPSTVKVAGLPIAPLSAARQPVCLAAVRV